MDARWESDAGRLAERANALLAERRVREALDLHERALVLGLDPLANGGERWMAAMLLGEYERAWAVSDLVLRRASPQDFDRRDRPFHLRPVWDGRPLEGRRVLVRCYHGLGDILHIARYLPALARRAKSVTVQAPDALHGVLSALPGVTAVDVELVTGGSSPVTVTSDTPLDPAAVDAAVVEAGYAVTPTRSLL